LTFWFIYLLLTMPENTLYYPFSIIFLQKISEKGIGMIENLFEFLDFKSLVYFRVFVSKDVSEMFQPVFKNLQVDVELKRMLPFKDPLGRRRPVSEDDKIAYMSRITNAFPNIRSMKLYPSWIFYRCGSSLLFLCCLDRLRRSIRCLQVSVMTDQALIAISNFSDLTDLDISFSYNVTKTGLSYISNLRKLTKLSLQGCKRIYDEDFHLLTTLVDLTSLNLDDTFIGNDSMLLLENFKNLKELKMNHCMGLSDFGINSLSICCPSLTSLEIARTDISDIALQFIGMRLKHLQYLSNTMIKK